MMRLYQRRMLFATIRPCFRTMASTAASSPAQPPPPQEPTVDDDDAGVSGVSTGYIETKWISLGHYPGLAKEAFPENVVKVLLEPINPKDVEIKPDGIIYLPEIKYRRILNS
jgi:hypothetical protein